MMFLSTERRSRSSSYISLDYPPLVYIETLKPHSNKTEFSFWIVRSTGSRHLTWDLGFGGCMDSERKNNQQFFDPPRHPPLSSYKVYLPAHFNCCPRPQNGLKSTFLSSLQIIFPEQLSPPTPSNLALSHLSRNAYRLTYLTLASSTVRDCSAQYPRNTPIRSLLMLPQTFPSSSISSSCVQRHSTRLGDC